MDIRYHTALRNATNAWAQNRMADTVTMQDLKHHAPQQHNPGKTAASPSASESALLQPELARYGNLGTRLNVFA